MSRNQREGYYFGKVNGRKSRAFRPTDAYKKKHPDWKKWKMNFSFGPVRKYE